MINDIRLFTFGIRYITFIKQTLIDRLQTIKPAQPMRTMDSEKYCLKWNDFERNVSQSFTQLRKETKLFDVTLVGNDHQQVFAHKLVLSACSDVFREIFYNNNNSNLVLYLESVGSREINLILDYIYVGEVQIYQEYLDRFLEVAVKLRLNGILANKEEETFEDPEQEVDPLDLKPKASENKRPIVKNSPETKIALPTNIAQSIESTNSEIENKFLEHVVKENGMFRCTVCNKTGYRANIRRHLETHLSGLSYECQICGKNFRSSESRRVHKIKSHKG